VSGGVLSGDRRWLTLGLIGLVTAVAFEGLAVATVMPRTAGDLDGLGLYGWAFSAFWLTNILGITLAGGDADRHGPARAFVAGVVVFAIGLAIAAAAINMPMLIVARGVQGFGSGAIGAVVYVVIARAYPAALHPRMLAIMSSAWVVPGLVGPALAAGVAEALHWRWVFGALTVPVVALGLVALRPIAALRPTADHAGDHARRAWAAVRLATGSLLFLTGLTVQLVPFGVPMIAGGAVLSAAALADLLPPGALRLRPGAAAVPLIVFGTAFAFFGAEAYIPLAITHVRLGTLAAGALAISAATITWTTGSWLQARLAPRGWRRGLVGAGDLLIAAGIGITALVLLPGLPLPVAAVGWAVGGLGMGLAYTTLTLLTLETAEEGREGSASAALQLTFTLGTVYGTGIGGAWVALADAGTLQLGPAIGIVFGIAAVIALLAALASRRLGSSGRATAPRTAEPIDAVAPPAR
jgi:MFS family permease